MIKKRAKPSKLKCPSLSVVIPAYNSEKTIERCLTALLEASPTNKEIIVVDDASTDNTVNIVSRFPVKLFRLTENSGPATARNYGIAQSTGDVVVFVDSDVIVKKDSLVALVNVLEEKCAGATGGLPQPIRNTLISDSYIVRILGKSPIAETGIREIQFAGGGLVAYPRKVLQEVGGHDEELIVGEDLDLNIRVGKAGYKQFLVPSAIAYHDHPSSLSTVARKWFRYGFWFFYVCTKHHLNRQIIQILGWVFSCFLLLFTLLWTGEFLLLPLLIFIFWLPWALYYGKFTLLFWVRMKKLKYLAVPLLHQIMILSRTLGFLYAIFKVPRRKNLRKIMRTKRRHQQESENFRILPQSVSQRKPNNAC